MTIHRGDSEISDGTPPEPADSEARPNRFLPKRNFFLTGREISYLPKNGRMKFFLKTFRLLRVKSYGYIEINTEMEQGGRPSYNLGLPAGGIRRPHPRLVIGGRGCGSPWSLHDMSGNFDRKIGLKT